MAGFSTAAAEKPSVVCESDASGRAMSCREAWPGEDAAPFRRIAVDPPAPTGAPTKPAQPMLAKPSTRPAAAVAAPDYLRNAAPAPATSIATTATLPTRAAANADPTLTAKTPSFAARAATPAKATSATVAAEVAAVAPAPSATPSAEAALATATATSARSDTATRAAEPVTTTAAVATTSANAAALPQTTQGAQQRPHAAQTANAAHAAEIATPESKLTNSGSAASTAAVAAKPPSQPAPAVAAVKAAGSVPDLQTRTAEPSSAPSLLGGREFAALSGSRHTLELANARSPKPLRELAARLQLNGFLYLIHLRNADADRWLLVWSEYASQADARAALKWVAADPAINSGWPRRLAPLQNELVFP